MKGTELPSGLKLFLVIAALAGCKVVFAQEPVLPGEKNKSGQGEIESVQYEIVVDRKINLPPANRNFEKIAPRPVEPIKPAITYELRNLQFATPDFNPSLRPLRLKSEELSRIYGNYISGGVGNYSAAFLEGYATTKRDKEKFAGIKLYHQGYARGPVDGKNSGSVVTELKLFGDRIGSKVTVGGFADFENKGGYFYGYPVGKVVERKSIAQNYSITRFECSVKNSSAGDFNFLLKGAFSYLSDHYNAKESEVGLNFSGNYKIADSKKVLMDVNYFLIARKDSLVEAKPRNILKVSPSYQFEPIENLSVSVGARVAIENDTIGKNKPFHFYPNLQANYNLSKSVEAYASLSGDIDKVNLHSLARENMWVNSNIGIFNTNRTADFSAGLRGNVGGKFNFGAGASFANLKDLYFFQNDQKSPSKFNTYYDQGNTKRTNLFVEASFASEQSFQWNFRADYFSYQSGVIDVVRKQSSFPNANATQSGTVLHLPAYRLNSSIHWNLVNKISLGANLVLQGGMKAIDFSRSDNQKLAVVTIKPAVDLNFKADYFVSKQFSVFIKLNNVLSNSYSLYLNYPVRSFQGLVGVTWSF